MSRRTSIHLVKIWIRRKVQDKWPIKKICEVYGISRSTFYRWYYKYKSGEIKLNDYTVDLNALAKDIKEFTSQVVTASSYGKAPTLKSSPDLGLYSPPKISKGEEVLYHPTQTLVQNLPSKYDKLYVFLMPRDPYWSFCYWEVPENLREDIDELILRVLDVSEEGREYIHFDINIGKTFIGNWYIPIGVPDRYYMVSLMKRSKGELTELCRSNKILLPRDKTLSSPKRDKGTTVVRYDMDMKVDWAISNLAEFVSSYYFSI